MYGPGPSSSVSPPVYIPGIQQCDEDDSAVSLLEQLDVQIHPGSLQDFYTKGMELGKGRFGVVFGVTKKETGEEFAGKIIRCIKAADKVKVRQEVELMNILRHPKLLQIMDAIENEREICIITEK
jgi:myosin-light-chain kinase